MNLSSHFQSVKSAADAIRSSYFALHEELRTIEQEAQRVKTAPVHRSDVAKVFDAWIQRAANDFNEQLAERVSRLAGLQSGQIPSSNVQLGFIAAPGELSERPTAGAIDGALCAVAGNEIRMRFMTALSRMERPDEGLPLAQRTVKLSELANRERAVRAELEQLVKQADEAGIELVRQSLG